MRTTVIALFLLILTGGLQAQNKQSAANQQQSIQSIVNQMQNYYMVILSNGPNRNQDSITAEKLQEGHMANIMKLAQEGKLVLAGPFLDEGTMRGIFIFDAANVEEVKTMVEADPTIKAGRMVYAIHPWMGPKSLKNVLKETFKPQK